MAKNAPPDVEDFSDPEMTNLDNVPLVEEPTAAPEPTEELAEQETPSAAGEDEATTRRSRRQRAADRGERTPAPSKNLDADPDFRAYKAKRDTEVETERRRRSDLERQWQEQQQQLQQQQVAALNRQLDEVDNDGQRTAIIENIAAIRGQTYAQQWLQWEQHKKARILEEGLEPEDTRFQRTYQGQEGALQFERDLLAASKEKLVRENAALKQAANPTTIQELVRKELARTLHAQGLNYTDTGEGAPDEDDSALQRDIGALNAGRMKAEAFAKKWGR